MITGRGVPRAFLRIVSPKAINEVDAFDAHVLAQLGDRLSVDHSDESLNVNSRLVPADSPDLHVDLFWDAE